MQRNYIHLLNYPTEISFCAFHQKGLIQALLSNMILKIEWILKCSEIKFTPNIYFKTM